MTRPGLGEAHAHMPAGLAGAERRRTSERVRSDMTSRASKSLHFGRAPYGYRRMKINDVVTWAQEPEEARAVSEMKMAPALEHALGCKRALGTRPAASTQTS